MAEESWIPLNDIPHHLSKNERKSPDDNEYGYTVDKFLKSSGSQNWKRSSVKRDILRAQ